MDPDNEELAKAIAEGTETVAYEGAFLALEESDSPIVSFLPANGKCAMQRLQEQYDASRSAKTSGDNGLPRIARGRRPTGQRSGAGTTTTTRTEEDGRAIYETYKDEAPMEDDVIEGQKYHYVQVVRWKEKCDACHRGMYGTPPGEDLPFRAVKITLPYRRHAARVNKNYAILLATAIMTVFLSMLALYIVVRYVIVKPLQHLQKSARKSGRATTKRALISKPTTSSRTSLTPTIACSATWSMRKISCVTQYEPGRQSGPVGPGQHAAVRNEPRQERLSGQREPRIAHAAE